MERVGRVQVLLAAADAVVLRRRRVEGELGKGSACLPVAFRALLHIELRMKARQTLRLLLFLLDVHAIPLAQG